MLVVARRLGVLMPSLMLLRMLLLWQVFELVVGARDAIEV